MSGFDFKMDEGDNTYRVEMDLFDDTIREAFKRLVRRQEEALEDGLKALGWMAPEDADAMRDAVNQHDALVAFVEAVRAWDAIFPVSTDVTDALADLDAQIGGN